MTTADESLTALVILLSLVIGIALYIWTALALGAMFRKLGEEAWKGWVPLLNLGLVLKWGGFSPWLVLLMLVPGIGAVVVWVLLIVAAHRLGPGFGYGGGMTVLAALLFVVWASILGFGPARWLGARLTGPPPVAPASPATSAVFAPPAESSPGDTGSWMPPAAPGAAEPAPIGPASSQPAPAPAGSSPSAAAVPDDSAPSAAPMLPADSVPPVSSSPAVAARATGAADPAGAASAAFDPGAGVGPFESRPGGAAGEPPRPADAPPGPMRSRVSEPAPGFSDAPGRDERAPATPASGHVNAQRPGLTGVPSAPEAGPSRDAGIPASTDSFAPRDDGEATAPADPDEHVDAWGSEIDEVSAVSPSPFPPSAAGSPRYVGTPVDTTGDPISFVPGRRSAAPPAAPVTRVPAPQPPAEPRVRQWPPSHYDPDVFPEMSGEVSAVVGSPAAGAPLSARRSVPAQESDPDYDDDVDNTVIARRKRPAWQIIPASGSPIALTSDVVILGRQPAPDPAHPRAQLVALDDRTRTVSKTHARLELRADGWQLTDLHSTNGVLLPTVLGTEVEIEPGSTVPAGDRFLLGDAEIRLTRGDA